MPLSLACSCGQHYAVDDQFAGQQVPCPMCGQVLTIPLAPLEPNVELYQPAPEAAPAPAPGRPALAALVATLLVLLIVTGGVVGLVAWLSNEPGESVAGVTPEPPPREEEKPVARPVQPPPPPRVEERPPPPRVEAPPPPRVERPVVRRPALKGLEPPSKVPWRGHSATILYAGFDQAGRYLWTASGGLQDSNGKAVLAPDSTLRRWDAGTGLEAGRLVLSDTGIGTATVSPSGLLAAVAAPGKSEIALYDLARGQKVRTLAEHSRPVRCLAFSGDSRVLLSGGEDNLVLAWDAASGKLLHRLPGHSNGVNQVAASADGKLAFSVGLDFSARVWNVESGRQQGELAGHGDIVWAVALSGDGRHVLTGGGMQLVPGIGLVAGARDHDVRLWEAATQRLVKRFPALSAPVSALAWSRDGRRFLAGGHHGGVTLWQVDTGKEVKRLEKHAARVRAVAFFPDGRRAVSAGEDGLLRIHELPLDLPELVRDLGNADGKVRLAAVAELARLGEEARPAVAALFEALTRRDDLRPRVLDVLRGLAPLGKEHVGRLVRLVGERDFEAGRLFALDELVKLGEEARPAAKTLLAALGDSSPAVRRKALEALTPVVDEVRGPAFKPLLAALDDRDASVRQAAGKALDKLGAPASEHLGTLRGLLSKERGDVRRYALKALGEMGEEARPALAELAERARRDSVAELRVLALEALGKIAPSDRQSVEAATKALADPEAAVNRQGAKLLAGAGDVPGLIAALEHDDAEVKATAGKALDRVRFTKKHVDLLVRLLESRDPALRKRGAEAVADLGKDGVAAVPALGKALAEAEEEEQNRLLGVIRKMGPAARAAGPSVAALLKTKDRGRRFEVCAVLVKIEAEEVKKAIPILIGLLRADDAESLEDEDAIKERARARELLASIGKPAVRPLVSALGRRFLGSRGPEGVLNGAARMEAIKTLMEIGPSAAGSREVLQVLVELYKDPFPGVRKAAREAYVKLQEKE